MTSKWAQSLKQSALDALDSIGRGTLNEAQALLADLEKAGHTVTLSAETDRVLVAPGPSEALAARIRRHKPDLIEVLRAGAELWRWKPTDVAIEVSLAKSAVTDFVLAPPVDGVGHTPLDPRLQRVLLAGATAEWQTRVKGLGGLVVYSMSQWEEAKKVLAEKLKPK